MTTPTTPRTFEIHYRCDDGSLEHWGEVTATDEAAALQAAKTQEPTDVDGRPLRFVARELKWCAKCGNVLDVVHLPGDTHELCDACAESAAPGQVVVTNVVTDGVLHVSLPAALAAHQQVAIATKDQPVVVHAAPVPSVALPHDAKPGEVFIVMLDEDGDAHVQRSTDTGAVLQSATMSTPRLLADLLASADRNLNIAIDGGCAFATETGREPNAMTIDDVRKVMHSLCRNLAQGLQGRVLP